MPREKTFTEADVEEAINQLKEAGKIVSNRNIREIIGKGSLTTIAEIRNNNPQWEIGEPKEPITQKIKELEAKIAKISELENQVAKLTNIVEKKNCLDDTEVVKELKIIRDCIKRKHNEYVIAREASKGKELSRWSQLNKLFNELEQAGIKFDDMSLDEIGEIKVNVTNE